MTGLLLTVALLGARQYRAAVLTAPITQGLWAGLRIDDAEEATRRVAARFRDIDERGSVGTPAPWPLRTEADNLLTGGDCGSAAGALGAAFVSRGRPFRIIQVNVGPEGAGHIMVETPDDDGRWVLLDAVEGRGFPDPRDGRLLGIDEIRAFPVDRHGWLSEEYLGGGEYSLLAPFRRTNWNRLGPFAGAVAAVRGEQWMTETSLRSEILASDRPLTEAAVVAMLLLAIAGWLKGHQSRE